MPETLEQKAIHCPQCKEIRVFIKNEEQNPNVSERSVPLYHCERCGLQVTANYLDIKSYITRKTR